jgi:hypothetical protein
LFKSIGRQCRKIVSRNIILLSGGNAGKMRTQLMVAQSSTPVGVSFLSKKAGGDAAGIHLNILDFIILNLFGIWCLEFGI